MTRPLAFTPGLQPGDKRSSENPEFLGPLQRRVRGVCLSGVCSLCNPGRSSGWTRKNLRLPFLKCIAQLIEHHRVLFAEFSLFSLIGSQIKQMFARTIIEIFPAAVTYRILVRVAPEKSAFLRSCRASGCAGSVTDGTNSRH